MATTKAVDFREDALGVVVREEEARGEALSSAALLLAVATRALEGAGSEAARVLRRLLAVDCSKFLLLGPEVLRRPAEMLVDCLRLRVVDALMGGALGVSLSVSTGKLDW